MVESWGYPDVGIYVGQTPSAGHDGIMKSSAILKLLEIDHDKYRIVGATVWGEGIGEQGMVQFNIEEVNHGRSQR